MISPYFQVAINVRAKFINLLKLKSTHAGEREWDGDDAVFYFFL